MLRSLTINGFSIVVNLQLCCLIVEYWKLWTILTRLWLKSHCGGLWCVCFTILGKCLSNSVFPQYWTKDSSQLVDHFLGMLSVCSFLVPLVHNPFRTQAITWAVPRYPIWLSLSCYMRSCGSAQDNVMPILRRNFPARLFLHSWKRKGPHIIHTPADSGSQTSCFRSSHLGILLWDILKDQK